MIAEERCCGSVGSFGCGPFDWLACARRHSARAEATAKPSAWPSKEKAAPWGGIKNAAELGLEMGLDMCVETGVDGDGPAPGL